MFPMLTVPPPPRFRPPPDPPSCKSLPLGFLSPLKPSDPPDPPEPPDPPDVTCLWSITAKYVAATRLPPPEIPLLFYPSLCSNFHPTIDSFTLVESILYSAIECSLPITTFYSAIECLLPITSWFKICLTSSRVEYSMLNCRFLPWLWFQILFINTLFLNQLQPSYYHGFCIVAAHVLQGQPLVWKIALQMICSLYCSKAQHFGVTSPLLL
ncbi:unnamed protein product [Brassica oleracea]